VCKTKLWTLVLSEPSRSVFDAQSTHIITHTHTQTHMRARTTTKEHASANLNTHKQINPHTNKHTRTRARIDKDPRYKYTSKQKQSIAYDTADRQLYKKRGRQRQCVYTETA